MNRKIKWVALASLGILVSIGYTSFIPTKSPPYLRSELFVDNDSILSKDFLGANAVYHGFAFMEDPNTKSMSDSERDLEFSRIKSLDLKIARTWYRPDWACGNNIYNKFDWNSRRMNAFYLWLDKMKELKVEVALQAGWEFPRDTYHNWQVPANQAKPDKKKDPIRFAEWVNESLHQLIEVRGFDNIKYLVLFTEPLNHNSGNIPDGISATDYYYEICTEINSRLKKSGLLAEVKFVGPNSGSTDTAAYVGWSANHLNDIIDIYSWHSYNGGQFNTNPPLEYDGWTQIVEAGKLKIAQTDKPFWIDEYGANKPSENVRFQPDYGNYLAQAVAAFTNAGAQTSLLWLLFDQKYPSLRISNKDSFYNGIQRWGLIRSPQDSIENPGTPYPSWYAFSMISRYLGGRAGTNTLRTRSSDSLFITCTSPSGKETTIMVVNASHVARNFSIKISKPLNRAMHRCLYDPKRINAQSGWQILPFDKDYKNVKNGFDDELPARAVAIYTTLRH